MYIDQSTGPLLFTRGVDAYKKDYPNDHSIAQMPPSESEPCHPGSSCEGTYVMHDHSSTWMSSGSHFFLKMLSHGDLLIILLVTLCILYYVMKSRAR